MWIYREAGTYDKEIAVTSDSAAVISLILPDDSRGTEIHLVLEVQDDSDIVPLYDYRRVVVYP